MATGERGQVVHRNNYNMSRMKKRVSFIQTRELN